MWIKRGLRPLNFMIFGFNAWFRRPGSRFSGQTGPRSSEMREMRVYVSEQKSQKKMAKNLTENVNKMRSQTIKFYDIWAQRMF